MGGGTLLPSPLHILWTSVALQTTLGFRSRSWLAEPVCLQFLPQGRKSSVPAWRWAFSGSGGDRGPSWGGGAPSPLGWAAGPLPQLPSAPGTAPQIPFLLLLSLGDLPPEPGFDVRGRQDWCQAPRFPCCSARGRGQDAPESVLRSLSPFGSSGCGCLFEGRCPLPTNPFPCWGWETLGTFVPQPVSHGTQTLRSIQRVGGHVHLISVACPDLSLGKSRNAAIK